MGSAAGATYTLSKSIDDASVYRRQRRRGGAERPRSPGRARPLELRSAAPRICDFTYELPFGANQRWFTNRQVGSRCWATGSEREPRVRLGNTVHRARARQHSDVARGTNGTLRANYKASRSRSPIRRPRCSSTPPRSPFRRPAAFGNAGRNTIIGPGSSVMNLGFTRNMLFGQSRALSIQLLASNVFNTAAVCLPSTRS